MDLKAGSALAATLVALTGCGESESGGAEDGVREGSPPVEERLSKAEAMYVERLDAICRESNENSSRVEDQIDRVQRRLVPRTEMNKRVVEILNESYVKSDRVQSRIRKLKAPPGEERFRRRYLAYSQRFDALNKRSRDAIARGENLRGDRYLALRRKARLVAKQRGALVTDHGGFRYCG